MLGIFSIFQGHGAANILAFVSAEESSTLCWQQKRDGQPNVVQGMWQQKTLTIFAIYFITMYTILKPGHG